jgi:6-phosphogluconolactonase (cycloisomerase 2 family)
MALARVLLCLASLLPLLITPADAAELTYRGAVQAGAGGVPDLYLVAAAVTPDGRHLYATAEEDDGTIAIFERDRGTGALTYLDDFRNGDDGTVGIAYVHDIVVSGDGLYVYVTTSTGIVRFQRNIGTGALDFKGYTLFDFGVLSGAGYPRSLAISADDAFLYATGGDPGSVTAFARNPETGAIAWIENELDAGIAARHFAGADRIQLSADGKHLYVTAEQEDAITLFSIDAITARSPGSATSAARSNPSATSRSARTARAST